MSEQRLTGLHYDLVDLPRGPAIYSNVGIYDVMFDFGCFSVRGQPFKILDAMCGAGGWKRNF